MRGVNKVYNWLIRRGGSVLDSGRKQKSQFDLKKLMGIYAWRLMSNEFDESF